MLTAHAAGCRPRRGGAAVPVPGRSRLRIRVRQQLQGPHAGARRAALRCQRAPVLASILLAVLPLLPHQQKLPPPPHALHAPQEFFATHMGLPLTMTPNYETFSCQFAFGKTPLPEHLDPAFAAPCFGQVRAFMRNRHPSAPHMQPPHGVKRCCCPLAWRRHAMLPAAARRLLTASLPPTAPTHCSAPAAARWRLQRSCSHGRWRLRAHAGARAV